MLAPDLFAQRDIEEPDKNGFDYLENVPDNARERIISLLGPSPIEIDDLIRESGEHAGLVLTVLLEMELAGKLQSHGEQRVSAA